MALSIRFQLRVAKRYQNPHPLQLRVKVDVEKKIGAVWENEKLVVGPGDWNVTRQLSTRRNDPVNDQIDSLRLRVKTIHKAQKAIAPPTTDSVLWELRTGKRPRYDYSGWVLTEEPEPSPKTTTQRLTELSPITDAYAAYVIELHLRKNKPSPITIARWHRGLLLLKNYIAQSARPTPACIDIRLGFLERYHNWLQTQSGGRHGLQPISEGQATRFVGFVGQVLDWLVRDGLLETNAKKARSWPKHEDKEVLFLEPRHVKTLMGLDWKGTKGNVLWWFCLMCCTGMDYPDAVSYARNRAAYEVAGPSGVKLRGNRKKPPHEVFEGPLLLQVVALFTIYPTGPADVTGQCVNRYTDQIEEVLEIDWRITAKTARKTFGCMMLSAGYSIAEVSRFLGHKFISTTERHYVRVRSEAVDRAMSRVGVNVL